MRLLPRMKDRSRTRRGVRVRGRVLLVAAALLLTACGSGGDGGPGASSDETFRFGVNQGVVSFDPIRVANPFQNVFLYPVYDRLVHIAPDGELVPGLAEAWDFNDQGDELTLTLREGVTFSDGESFDAPAVQLNLERARDTDTSTVAGALAGLESVDVTDERTVVIDLAEPDLSILGTLAERAGMMVSPQAIEAGDLDNTMVGTGQYTLTEHRIGDRVIYDQREDYWDEDALSTARLELHALADSQARASAVQSGEVHAAAVEADNVTTFEDDDRFTVHADPVMSFYNITFGTEEFEDPRVRRAVSLALDRDALNEVVNRGLGVPLSQPWPDSYFAAAQGLSTEQDAGEAERLLAEAGFPDGLSFTAATPSLEPHPRLVEMMQSMLAEVGVTMEVVLTEPAQIADVYYSQRQHDALIAVFPGSPDPLITVAQRDLPSGFYNREGYSSDRVNELYERAKSEVDDQSRVDLIHQLSAAIHEEQTETPLISLVRPTVVSTDVDGWEHYVTAVPEFRGISLGG